MQTHQFDLQRHDNNFSYCIARFMEQYGFRLSEHIYFLLSCSLWLNILPSGNDHNGEKGSIPCVETQNPYRYEYLSSAFDCPYQYRIIDGKNALFWIMNRINKKEPLLLEIPESLLSNNGNVPSDDARMVCALVKGTHEPGALSDESVIELHITPSQRKAISYKGLTDFISRHPEVKGIMYFAPLHLKSNIFLHEMVVQSIIKQYYVLYSCFYDACDFGIKNMKEDLLKDGSSPDMLQKHMQFLKRLNYSHLIEEYPSLNREYYAQSLQEAACLFDMDLSKLADVFHQNAITWNNILSEVKNKSELSIDNIACLYDTMLSAERILLDEVRAVIGPWIHL